MDLLHSSPEEEKRKHKKKCLVQNPSSYFMDMKFPGLYPCTHGSLVRWLIHCPVSYRQKSKAGRRMLL
ncbi:rCG28933 [Rattus norvegicus]|uniref:RCG28933 n=1 Tax=Rattus norvegicus TaxID=10116 RepID=A6HVB6_RAT|nr:rCG28933 [Rattus norvegicus]